MSWVDMRFFRIQFYTDHPATPDSEPEQVVLILPGGDPDEGAFVRDIEEVAVESGTSYFLKDNRTYANWGASGGTQQPIIELMSDPGVRDVAENLGWQFAKGAAFGAKTLFLKGLINRADKVRRRNYEQENRRAESMAREQGQPLPQPIE